MIPLILDHSGGDGGSTTTLRIDGRTFYQSYSSRNGRATFYEMDAQGECIDATRKFYPVNNFTPSAGFIMRQYVQALGVVWPEKVVA